jgi:hypothetical protein
MVKDQTGIRGDTDRRIIDRKLMHCQITDKELKKYLTKLPDLSANAEQVIIEMEQRPSCPAK